MQMQSADKTKRHLFIAILLLGFASMAWGQEEPSRSSLPPDAFFQIASITEAGPPRVFDEMVVFTWEGTGFTRYVAAAFGHERYQTLHRFVVRTREDRDDLFLLVYPISPGMRELEYRLIVDGVWMVDPAAPVVRRDRHGVSIGAVALREAPPYRVSSPQINNDGTITFFFTLDLRVTGSLDTVDQRQVSVERFRNPRVNIVGSFNGWDPFMHRLRPSPGRELFWEVTIPVPPGDHYYYFLVDGERILDPFNLQFSRDRQTNGVVSTFRVRPEQH